MIPKIIHYCWFGGKEMPAQLKKYIKSWKKYCPDYEIKLWNEENFDINSNQYVKEAYENKKYAFFVSQNSCCPIQSIILSCISIPPKSSLLHHDKWYSSALPIPCCPAFLISL